MQNPESVGQDTALSRRPMVASYIVTFLKPEMWHVYRQVRRLQRWQTVVFCQKRENPSAFPFSPVEIVRKPLTHQIRRWWQKTVLKQPIMIYAREARTLRRTIEQRGAQLLHIYFGHIGVHLLPLIEILPIPTVVSFHGADAQVDLDQSKHRAAARRMIELSRLLLVRSNSLADRLAELGCPPEKIRIHRTGIPMDEIHFRQRSAPSDGAWRCVQASRLIAKKGLSSTVRAFAEFSREFPKARLTFAGEGSLHEQTWNLAVELGIADRVNFTGFLSQPELRALYDRSHIFFHPSVTGPDGDQEGVPNAMLEAMAMGVPPLATTHGGIPEAVEHGRSGILVAERDHATLARELSALAHDPERYASMSQQAAERVGRMFDLRVTIAALESYYDEAIR